MDDVANEDVSRRAPSTEQTVSRIQGIRFKEESDRRSNQIRIFSSLNRTRRERNINNFIIKKIK